MGMNKNVPCKDIINCTNVKEIKMIALYLKLRENLENKDSKKQPQLETTEEWNEKLRKQLERRRRKITTDEQQQ